MTATDTFEGNSECSKGHSGTGFELSYCIADPSSIDVVKQEYDNLTNAINNMGEKISGVLSQQEIEFLGAYRTHKRNVQQEFNALRLEAEDRERKLSENDDLRRLEKDRDWYRNEALHLDKLLEKSKMGEKKLIEKVSDLEEEKNW